MLCQLQGALFLILELDARPVLLSPSLKLSAIEGALSAFTFASSRCTWRVSHFLAPLFASSRHSLGDLAWTDSFPVHELILCAQFELAFLIARRISTRLLDRIESEQSAATGIA